MEKSLALSASMPFKSSHPFGLVVELSWDTCTEDKKSGKRFLLPRQMETKAGQTDKPSTLTGHHREQAFGIMA